MRFNGWKIFWLIQMVNFSKVSGTHRQIIPDGKFSSHPVWLFSRFLIWGVRAQRAAENTQQQKGTLRSLRSLSELICFWFCFLDCIEEERTQPALKFAGCLLVLKTLYSSYCMKLITEKPCGFFFHTEAGYLLKLWPGENPGLSFLPSPGFL